ncbi:MAG: phage terminase large subunit [Rickettsiaceae bacterium]
MECHKQVLDAVLRQDFSSFISKVFHTVNPSTTYQDNWHIDLIADYLTSVQNGSTKRLIINMPPRALKSVCVSVAWPAWLLGHNPATRLIVASYSSILSIKHSLDCRLILGSTWYQNLFPKTRLSTKHNQKSKFLTSQNGFRFATSVGGSTTGEGGDILIIDDPHNPTQINSLKYRSKAIEWFEQTFVTRLNDQTKGGIVLVMQRLHEDDLSSHLISSGGWELLQIPVLASKNHYYKIGTRCYEYKKGETLNKSRDQMEFLHNIEQEIGCRNFAAQFLQNPLPSSISLLPLEDICYYEELPGNFAYYVISWDTAIKLSEKSDYSVGTCWGIADDKYYFISMIRKKMSYPELKIAIEKQIGYYQPRYILIEDKASGQSLIQDLMLAGYANVKPIKPKQDKVTRFASVVPIFQNGKSVLPRKCAMQRILINELTSFPNSKHDVLIL